MPGKYTRIKGGGGESGRPKSAPTIQARPFTMVAPQGGNPRDAARLHAQQVDAQQACANNPASCSKSGGGGVKGRNTTFTYPTFATSGPPQALDASDTSKAAATTGAATTVQSSDDHYATQPIPKAQSGGRRRGRKGGKRSRRAGRSVKWGCSSGGTRRVSCRCKSARKRRGGRRTKQDAEDRAFKKAFRTCRYSLVAADAPKYWRCITRDEHVEQGGDPDYDETGLYTSLAQRKRRYKARPSSSQARTRRRRRRARRSSAGMGHRLGCRKRSRKRC